MGVPRIIEKVYREPWLIKPSVHGSISTSLLTHIKGDQTCLSGPKYEGYMRVPTLIWWPGTVPTGKVSHEIASTIDVLPSLAKLTGAKVPDDRTIDGKNVLSVLMGKPGAKSPHEILYYEIDGIRRGPPTALISLPTAAARFWP